MQMQTQPNDPVFAHWGYLLFPDFHWIATDIFHQDISNHASILVIVDRILDTVDDDPMDPITTVYQSSIWAVCMAYKDDKTGTQVLSRDEHDYASRRGGILGLDLATHTTVSTRELLRILDPGFRWFPGNDSAADAPFP